MTRCDDCFHNEACQAWIRHGETLYDDFKYTTVRCPYFVAADEVEPVVLAHWECECEPYCFCSNCHHKFSLFDRVPRCPNCGAHMDEK
jgi:hypothetical protein